MAGAEVDMLAPEAVYTIADAVVDQGTPGKKTFVVGEDKTLVRCLS